VLDKPCTVPCARKQPGWPIPGAAVRVELLISSLNKRLRAQGGSCACNVYARSRTFCRWSSPSTNVDANRINGSPCFIGPLSKIQPASGPGTCQAPYQKNWTKILPVPDWSSDCHKGPLSQREVFEQKWPQIFKIKLSINNNNNNNK